MNRENKLVSVIIPVYNAQNYIGAAIESVLGQTYRDWELVAVDDCSSDSTREIIAGFVKRDSRIKLLVIEQNSGRPAVPRNYGIMRAKGEYIAFLDADDQWMPGKLKEQLPHFNAPEIIGVGCQAKFVSDTPYYRKNKFKKNASGYDDYSYSNFLAANPVITSSLVVRRKDIEKAGFFDEGAVFAFIEDWELWLRMARFGNFRILNEKLLDYTVSRKRGLRAVEISRNSMQVLEKQNRLGYADEIQLREPKSALYLSIARDLMDFNSRQSKIYYRLVFNTTTKLRRKIKSAVGLVVLLFPRQVQKSILKLLYKIDKAINL